MLEKCGSYDFDGELVSSTPIDIHPLKISETSGIPLDARNAPSGLSHGNLLISYSNEINNRRTISNTSTIIDLPATDVDSTRSYVEDEDDGGLVILLSP